jgi:hypothetical protein
MNSYAFVLTLHVLAATVWTGGHLVLALVLLPRVLRERAVKDLLRFESGYERSGWPGVCCRTCPCGSSGPTPRDS